jgi:hypothetical protein
MGLYNFHRRFVAMIEAGTKTHTIRATRRHPDKPGSTLHLYTGLRQRGARLLRRVVCTDVQKIVITRKLELFIDGVQLAPDERETLAKLDGFRDFAEMMEFWNGRRPFIGLIIHWG